MRRKLAVRLLQCIICCFLSSGDGIAGNKLECVSIGKIIESGSEESFLLENDCSCSEDEEEE